MSLRQGHCKVAHGIPNYVHWWFIKPTCDLPLYGLWRYVNCTLVGQCDRLNWTVSSNGSLYVSETLFSHWAVERPRLTSDDARKQDGVDLKGGRENGVGVFSDVHTNVFPPSLHTLRLDAHNLTVRSRLNGHPPLTEINGLVHSAKRPKPVSAHVLLHYKRVIPGFV